MNRNAINQRINWIDWGKAIAIYFVVLTHTVTPEDALWVQEANRIGCGFHVPLFFFISGYLFHVKQNNFATFCKASAWSLLVPYMFFNIVSAVPLYKLQAPEVWHRGLVETFLGMGHCFAGPAWFLVALFCVRLVVFWLHRIQSPVSRWCIVLGGGNYGLRFTIYSIRYQ